MDPHETVTDLDAHPDLVWQVLTDDEGVGAWLGEGSRLEPVEGGELDATDPETGIHRHGRVHDAEPGRRLEYTWWPADDPEVPASTVRIDLVPTGAGTRLVVTETPVTTASALAMATVASWPWRLASIELRLCGTGVGHVGSPG